jgi:hypothetical protein
MFKGSIAAAADDLLLGQSYFTRLKSWSIDNVTHSLVLSPLRAQDMPPIASPAQASGTKSRPQISSPSLKTQTPKKLWPNE